MTFYVGDIVRKKNGLQFELDDVNPNPNYKEDDELFASGWSEYGTEDVEDESDIELVMSAKDAKARVLPTEDEIAGGLNLLGDGWNGVVDVIEMDKEGASLLCYGTTRDGLSVSFRVTVSDVEREIF